MTLNTLIQNSITEKERIANSYRRTAKFYDLAVKMFNIILAGLRQKIMRKKPQTHLGKRIYVKH